MVDSGGPRERRGWGPKQEQVGCRVPDESDEVLEIVLWLIESGLSGVFVKPLLHTGPREAGFGFSFKEGLPLVQCQPLDWNHLEDGARKSHVGLCTVVGGRTQPPSPRCGGHGCGIMGLEHLGRLGVPPKVWEVWQSWTVLRDKTGTPAGYPCVPAQA